MNNFTNNELSAENEMKLLSDVNSVDEKVYEYKHSYTDLKENETDDEAFRKYIETLDERYKMYYFISFNL